MMHDSRDETIKVDVSIEGEIHSISDVMYHLRLHNRIHRFVVGDVIPEIDTRKQIEDAREYWRSVRSQCGPSDVVIDVDFDAKPWQDGPLSTCPQGAFNPTPQKRFTEYRCIGTLTVNISSHTSPLCRYDDTKYEEQLFAIIVVPQDETLVEEIM
jgi:hypothetical protein